jgi:excisionase family DNA binding protein
MVVRDEILTAAEVAADLRCSKAHVYNMINGKVAGVTPLPAITMGRRRLVRRSSLELWKNANEQSHFDAMMRRAHSVDAALGA